MQYCAGSGWPVGESKLKAANSSSIECGIFKPGGKREPCGNKAGELTHHYW